MRTTSFTLISVIRYVILLQGDYMVYKVHKRNIEGKIERDYRGIGGTIRAFYEEVYLPFETNIGSIRGITTPKIEQRVGLFNSYYPKSIDFQNHNGISSQSKFCSSVIEEFVGYLLKDIPSIRRLGLSFFTKSVFAGVKIGSDGDLEIQVKDVDIALAKEFRLSTEDEEKLLVIPVVAIECKTYLDNTMFSEAQFTAQKLKNGTPSVKAVIFTLDNQVGLSKLPSVSPIDEIYVLATDKITVDITTAVSFVKDVKKYIDEAKERSEPSIPGKLLNP